MANSQTAVNFKAYQTKPTTLKDLMQKYGFDYSKGYARQQAQAEYDQKRVGLNNQLQQVDTNVKGANDALSRQYFQNYMNQAQGQVGSGITGGMKADQNVRLSMSRQAAMGDIYRDAAVQKSKINQDLTNVNQEQVAKQNQLYNDRLQQGFQNAQAETASNRAENQTMLNAAQTERDQKWREYTFNNMNATEKTQFEWTKKTYGEDVAWRLFELQYKQEQENSAAQAELDFYNSGLDNASEGGGYSNNYKTQQSSNSPTYKSYQGHLKEAIKMGVPANWANALTELVGRESSWNPSAKNPSSTAHGYGQFLNSTRANYEKKTGLNYSNPVHQLVMMAQYVKDRYGTPEKALAFWDKNKWYLFPLVTTGSILTKLTFGLL